MDRLSASKVVALRVAKARAKGSDDGQLDLFMVDEELGKARFSSRSEAGRYAANMRWRGRTGDLTDTNARDFAQFGELSAKQLKEVAARAKDLARTGLVVTPEAYYKDNAQSFNFPVPGFQGDQSAGSKVNFTTTIPGYASDRYTHFRGLGFDGQVVYMIGNEGENPSDLSFNFALQTPNKGFIGETIQGSDWKSKVMYSSSPKTTNTIEQTKALTVEHNQALGRLISERLKTLNIREIAQGIEQEYKNMDKTIPRAVANAITSMKSMRNIDDVQGYSTGQKVVSDAVKSLASFNSEIGKLVRTELRSRVKNAVPKATPAGLRRAQSLPFNELRP